MKTNTKCLMVNVQCYNRHPLKTSPCIQLFHNFIFIIAFQNKENLPAYKSEKNEKTRRRGKEEEAVTRHMVNGGDNLIIK